MRLIDEHLQKAAHLEKLAGSTKDALLKRSYLDQAISYKLLAADLRRSCTDQTNDRVA
jgi:hypothetical protein